MVWYLLYKLKYQLELYLPNDLIQLSPLCDDGENIQL